MMGLLGVPKLATSAGYELREQGAVGQGVSFAGAAARGDDPSFLFFNPAAMAWMAGTQAALIGSGIFPQVEAERGNAARNPALGATRIVGSLGGDAALDAFLPAFYASTSVGSDWRIGLSVTGPWGLVTKYPADFLGRYHALTSSLRTVNLAPSVAWRPLPTFAIGAALQIQYADVRLSNAVDFGGIGSLNPSLRAAGARPGLTDGRATVAGDNTAIGWHVGAQWEPTPGTRLGAAFRSAVFHDLSGEARFEGVPAPLAAAFANTGVRAKLTTPETFNFGFSQQLGRRWTLLAGAEWTKWSRFRDLIVNYDDRRTASSTQERWHDTWFLSTGAEYRMTDAVTLRGGVAWDMSPVREATRTPRIPDTDRYWLSAGVGWRAMSSLTLSIAYTHVIAGEGRVRLRDGGPGSGDFLRGDLNADYSASVDILSVQASFTF